MSAAEKLAKLKEAVRARQAQQEAGHPDPTGPVYYMGTEATEAWKTAAREPLRRLREAKRGTRTPVEKMVNTIVAIIDARLSGLPESAVFDREDTCAKTTYYTKWLADEEFAAALEEATRLAYEWKDGWAMSRVRQAAEMLQVASPDMVAIALAVAKLTFTSGDYAAALRASFGALDRADVKTAVKSGVALDASVSRRDVVNLADLDPEAAAAFLANTQALRDLDDEGDEDAGPD